jgi:hypothetical protein
MPVWDKAAFDQFYSSGAERWGHPNTRPGIRLHYHDYSILRHQRSLYAPQLFALLGMNAGDDVILVGCGFNSTAEGLADLGVRVIGLDTSDYIQAEKANTEEAEIRAIITGVGLDPDIDLIIGKPGNLMVDPLDVFLRGGRASPQPRGWGQILGEDMKTNGSKRAVIRAFETQYPSAAIRFVISEEVLNSITDAEALLVCEFAGAAAADWGATVVHMLSPLKSYKTGQAPELNWKTYAGWRAFLDAEGFGAQLILPTVTAWDQGVTPLSVDLPDRPNTVVAYSGTF